MIAQDTDGIMVLLKRDYLIDTIYQNRNMKVKVTIRFFNLNEGVIHTTDKTEIELDDEVFMIILFKK